MSEWWEKHENLVYLVRYLADEGYDGTAIAYAVEKPWKYEDEFRQALIELSVENATDKPPF